jgi:hypothetical protein
MNEKDKADLVKEIRRTIKSLNNKIREANRHHIAVVVLQENEFYAKLSDRPNLVSVEIREEHIL